MDACFFNGASVNTGHFENLCSVFRFILVHGLI